MNELSMWIDGAPAAAASQATMPVENPATEEVHIDHVMEPKPYWFPYASRKW